MASVFRQVGVFHANNRKPQQTASASLQLISPGDSQQPLANQSGTTSSVLLNELSLHFKDCDVVSSCRENSYFNGSLCDLCGLWDGNLVKD